MKDSRTTTDVLLLRTFARLDATALGIAVGAIGGVGLFAATSILLLKGGAHVGQNLSLLSQFFPGYRVTWRGAVIGLGYGLVAGFVAGWVLAKARNAAVGLYLQIARAKAAAAAARNFFDNV
jgi:hypothetical protein